MALVDCSECGKQISDKASSCPHCGSPVSNISSIKVGIEKPIELTAKRFKLISLLSVLIFLFGWVLFFIIISNTPSKTTGSFLPMLSLLLILSGLISYIINRVRIWWHHK